ncbi:hypothetical protein [Bacillus sp. M6-12]|uniref:hypothetical protein n=1 Tax=Bacillus sp. M6-12 TaxID=2054166 RepID=UPI00115AC0B8|nr:hypothetical protein [Bacillus sp. M6-12]
MQNEQNQVEKLGVTGWICLVLFGALVLHFFYFWTFGLYFGIKEDKAEHEAYLEQRQEGIETFALVIDKKFVGGKNPYHEITLYVKSLNEEHKVKVQKEIYDPVQSGDFIEVVVKDNNLYFGNKSDEDHTIRFEDNEIVNQEEKIKK